MADTTYMVFERDDTSTNGVWQELGQVDAPTPKAAMERMAERVSKQIEEDIPQTRYAATPYRNWTELPVGVEVVRRVKVG